MIKVFLLHQYQKFFRNPRWKSSIVMSILLGIFVLYLILISFQIHYFIKEYKPDVVPVNFINNYLIYLFMTFFISGIFFQKIAFENIQHYLHLNIRKKWIVNFLLVKTLFGPKTIIVWALFTPFAFVSVMGSYSFTLALLWLLNIYLIIFSINLVIQLLKLIFQINVVFRVFVLLLFVGVGLAKYMDYINLERWSLPIFGYVFHHPLYVLVPIIGIALLYALNFRMLKNAFYADALQDIKLLKLKSGKFDWLALFGENKELIRYNIRLILRNKKCKIQFFLFSLFPFIYTYLIYDDLVTGNGKVIVYVISLMLYAFFWINYFSFFFSWDSKNFDNIQASSIDIKKYISSRIIAVMLLTSIHYLPGFVLIYFIPNYFIIFFSVVMLHFGIFVPYLVYFSLFGVRQMDINRSPFMNYEGANYVQFFISVPLIVFSIIPIIIFTKNLIIGYMINSFIGFIGFLFFNKFINIINNKYQKDKYFILEELR
jgi:hypothetical protein